MPDARRGSHLCRETLRTIGASEQLRKQAWGCHQLLLGPALQAHGIGRCALGLHSAACNCTRMSHAAACHVPHSCSTDCTSWQWKATAKRVIIKHRSSPGAPPRGATRGVHPGSRASPCCSPACPAATTCASHAGRAVHRVEDCALSGRLPTSSAAPRHATQCAYVEVLMPASTADHTVSISMGVAATSMHAVHRMSQAHSCLGWLDSSNSYSASGVGQVLSLAEPAPSNRCLDTSPHAHQRCSRFSRLCDATRTDMCTRSSRCHPAVCASACRTSNNRAPRKIIFVQGSKCMPNELSFRSARRTCSTPAEGKGASLQRRHTLQSAAAPAGAWAALWV